MSDKSFSAFRATGAPLSADTVGLAKLATGPISPTRSASDDTTCCRTWTFLICLGMLSGLWSLTGLRGLVYSLVAAMWCALRLTTLPFGPHPGTLLASSVARTPSPARESIGSM